MDLIDKYVSQYEKEYDFYKQVARLGHDILETEIINRGIKALVSDRAKRVDRLREKITKRNQRKNYKTKNAIEQDIVDLAGIRVALYFPSEREIIGQVIKDLFEVVETKEFPENKHVPKLNKRFSGYWATHYRVKFKESRDIDARFTKTIFEIQVASVLMHAWSEVEHDLVYKPFADNLSENELAILDEINGLVLAGEIALERLQKAITERTEDQKEIRDKYELTNLVFSSYTNIDSNKNKKINFGNTKYLANYLKIAQKIDTSQLIESVSRVNQDAKESFSDQLFQNIIKINKNQNNLKKYFEQITTDKKMVSGFELFIKTWIVFEKVVAQIVSENGIPNKNAFSLNSEKIKKIAGLTEREYFQLKKLRNVRNYSLHGEMSFSNKKLEQSHKQLKLITQKLLLIIKDKEIKEILEGELK